MHNVDKKNIISFLINSNEFVLILVLLFFCFLSFGGSYNIPLVILACLGCFIVIVDNKYLINDSGARLYIVLFACIFLPMLLSLPDAINPAITFRKIIGFTALMFAGFPVIKSLRNQNYLNHFLMFLGLLLTFWIIDALWQYVVGKNIFGYPFKMGKFNAPGGGRLTGIFYPDFRIGIVLAILSPLYFEFVRVCQERFILSWLMIIPLMLVILLAGSRASWAMLLLSCILYSGFIYHAGYYRKFRMRSFVIAAIVLISGLILLNRSDIYEYRNFKAFLLSRISSISYKSDDLQHQTALEQRVELWESALRISKNHLINGIGVRGFRFVDKDKELNSVPPIISEQTRLSTHPHQITLEILVETGVIGIIGFIIFWVYVCRSSLSVIKRSEPSAYLIWIMPVIIAVFPLNMHKSFYEHFSFAIIWMLISLAMASYPVRNSASTN